MSKQLVIYIAGPYRAEHERGVVLNIRKAEDLALEAWRLGHAVICPHKNTALLGGSCPDQTWLRGDITMMLRCDAVLLVEGWERSSGTRAEVEEAKRAGIEVFESLDVLDAWAQARAANRVKPLTEFEAMMQIARQAVGIASDLHGVMKDVDESAAIELDDAGGLLASALSIIDRQIANGWKPPERVRNGVGTPAQRKSEGGAA